MYKAVAILILYAVLVVALGVLAYTDAPEGASAKTALIVPIIIAAASLACVVMSLMIYKKRTIGMIGIHLGIVIPLLVAIGVGQRAYVTHESSKAYRAGQEAWALHVEAGAIGTPEAKEKYFEEHPEYPDHDKGYLSGTLVAIAAVSLQTFVALMLARPKPPARKPKAKPAETDDAS